MAHYNIFHQQLAVSFPAYGHALWEPRPGEFYPTVEVGDVGFIREGKFHRLFNTLLPANHPSHQRFGIPEHYEPLQVNISPHIDTGILSPNNFHSANVKVGSVGGGIFSGPDSERVSFSCSKAGAILSLPVPARSQDTLAQGYFGGWIVKNIDDWFAFTRRLGLGITRMADIVLVTGCHLTRSFANIAFSDGCGEGHVSFEVRTPSISNVEWRFPLDDIQGVALNVGPSGQNLPEDKCIFIRGFRATRLLGILPRLRGAAEPTQGPHEDEPEPEPDMHLITTPSDIKDPLHILLEYITTELPDCDMALVHDDDLIYIEGSSLETLRSDKVIDHLQKSAPRIWQVECSSSETETPVINVGTLTKYSFGTPTNPSVQLPSDSQVPSKAARDQNTPQAGTELLFPSLADFDEELDVRRVVPGDNDIVHHGPPIKVVHSAHERFDASTGVTNKGKLTEGSAQSDADEESSSSGHEDNPEVTLPTYSIKRGSVMTRMPSRVFPFRGPDLPSSHRLMNYTPLSNLPRFESSRLSNGGSEGSFSSGVSRNTMSSSAPSSLNTPPPTAPSYELPPISMPYAEWSSMATHIGPSPIVPSLEWPRPQFPSASFPSAPFSSAPSPGAIRWMPSYQPKRSNEETEDVPTPPARGKKKRKKRHS